MWTRLTNGQFLVASLFSILMNASTASSFIAKIWKFKAPSRVITFGWFVIMGNILKMDNLKTWIMIN